jgi:hypothetical protein
MLGAPKRGLSEALPKDSELILAGLFIEGDEAQKRETAH